MTLNIIQEAFYNNFFFTEVMLTSVTPDGKR